MAVGVHRFPCPAKVRPAQFLADASAMSSDLEIALQYVEFILRWVRQLWGKKTGFNALNRNMF